MDQTGNRLTVHTAVKKSTLFQIHWDFLLSDGSEFTLKLKQKKNLAQRGSVLRPSQENKETEKNRF